MLRCVKFVVLSLAVVECNCNIVQVSTKTKNLLSLLLSFSSSSSSPLLVVTLLGIVVSPAAYVLQLSTSSRIPRHSEMKHGVCVVRVGVSLFTYMHVSSCVRVCGACNRVRMRVRGVTANHSLSVCFFKNLFLLGNAQTVLLVVLSHVEVLTSLTAVSAIGH